MELAAASKSKKEREAVELAARNEEMKARLQNIRAKTDDGDGLIGGGVVATQQSASLPDLNRASDVWRGAFLRNEVKRENREMAEFERETRASLQERRRSGAANL